MYSYKYENSAKDAPVDSRTTRINSAISLCVTCVGEIKDVSAGYNFMSSHDEVTILKNQVLLAILNCTVEIN